jgi:hypothetical protein
VRRLSAPIPPIDDPRRQRPIFIANRYKNEILTTNSQHLSGKIYLIETKYPAGNKVFMV